MAWEFDAPTGVYKNHWLSSQIREASAADALFARFASPERGYGKGKGESVDITRVMQLPLAGRVSESDRLPEGRPAVDTKQVTVSEWGFKTNMTEFEESLTHFDLRNKFQRMLRTQMTLTMDKMVADAFKQTPIKVWENGGTVSFANDGVFGAAADANLSIDAVREIRDYMKGTLKAPAFRNGLYAGILSTKAARGIKNDTTYQQWLSHTTREPFVTGQMTNVEGIMLFETNHFDALLDGIGTGGVTGEAVFFGDDGTFLATVLDPELRVGLSEDLGRFREVGWYGIIEAGLTWDRPAEARVVHWGSQ